MSEIFSPEEVTVCITSTGYDDLGEPCDAGTERIAASCLVAPGSSADLDASRPSGVSVAMTLHFPKTWERSLRGATVEVRGKSYRVVGDPQPYTAANVPGAYNMPVEVEAVDG